MTKKLLSFVFLLTSLNAIAQESADTSIYQKLDDYIESAHAAGKFNGTALIAQHGRVVLQKGYGFKDVSTNSTNDINTIYQIGSITKCFTAVIILKLQEEGKLSVQDRLSKFFPDFPKADKIIVQNLLTHTSGLHNYTDVIDENDSAIISNPVPKERVLQTFENSSLLFKPGRKFEYNNSGYFLLGMIIEKITGKQYETVVREMILGPLDMSQSGFDYKNLRDPNKSQGYDFLDNEKIKKNITVDSTVYFSAGAMYSTVGDLLKFCRGLMGHQLINDTSLRQAFTPFKENYGYGFYVDTLIGRKYIRHSGGLPGFVSEFIYYPTDDATIILLNNVGYYGSSLFPVATGISGILFGLPTQNWQQRKEIKLDDTTLMQYVGTYRYNPQTDLIVSFKNGKLFVLCTNPKAHLPKVQLYPESDTLFFIKEAPLKFEFSRDPNTQSLKLTTYNSFGKDADWTKIK